MISSKQNRDWLKVYPIGFTFILFILIIFHITTYFHISRKNLIKELNNLFIYSAHDYINKMNFYSQKNVIYEIEPIYGKDSIIVMTENGEVKYPRAINDKLDLNPIFNISFSRYYLSDQIEPDSIYHIYQNTLKENNIFITSCLLYKDNIKQDSVYICPLVKHLTPIYDTYQYVGVGNEIGFQCYANIPILLILKRITLYQWSVIAGWFLLLVLAGSFFIYRYKKVYKSVLDTVSTHINTHYTAPAPSKPSNLIYLNQQIKLDKITDSLQVDDSSYLLKGKSLDLFLAFMDAPDYALSYEDIRRALWKDEHRSDEAIRSCVSRLKKDLSFTDKISITNYPGKGYRIVIKE